MFLDLRRRKTHTGLLILLISGILAGVISERAPPRILVNDVDEFGSISLPVSSDLALTCEGDEAVKWKTHSQKNISSRSEQDSMPFGDKFQTTLVVKNTIFTDTGTFTCRYESSMGSDAPEDSTDVYVFINDPANILLPFEGANFFPIFQGVESIIPCKSSNRNANVTLWKKSGTNTFKNFPVDNLSLKFDPTRGFLVNFAGIEYSGEFKCSGTYDKVTDEKAVILQWLPSTNILPTPTVETQSRNAVKDSSFMLYCSVWSPSGVMLFLDWNLPSKKYDKSRIKIGQPWSTEVKRNSDKYTETKLNITINPVQDVDRGTYTCVVKDITGKSNQKSIYLEIKEMDEPFIKFSLGDGSDPNEAFEMPLGSSSVKFAVSVEAYPIEPTLKWYKGDLQLSNSLKFRITNSSKTAILEILNLERTDTGFYTLVGAIGSTVEELRLTLMVIEKPEVSIRPQPPMYEEKAVFTIRCHVAGCPGSNISWYWSPCLSPKSCEKNYILLDGEIQNEEREAEISGEISDGCHVESVLNGKVKVAGHYKCQAINQLGSDEAEASIFIKDHRNPLVTSANNLVPYEGDPVTLSCHASMYIYQTIQWFFIPQSDPNIRMKITNSSNVRAIPGETTYSWSMDVNINPTVLENTGRYVCEAKTKNNSQWDEKEIRIQIQKTVPAFVLSSNLNKTQYTVFKEASFEFFCLGSGVPPPVVNWYLNGSRIQAINDSAIQFLEDNSRLYIARTLPSDSGNYTCEMANKAGAVILSAGLKVLDADGPRSLSKASVIGIIVFILVALIVIIVGGVYLGKKLYKERKEKKDWEELQHDLFNDGEVGVYNPELSIQDQVETLPYDRSFEIPKDRLRLGRVLGAGAFGKVLKGEIHRYTVGEEWTTVAVKMPKERADTEQRKALMQELKIMIHIGRHINVVNLIGAVTNNIAKGELQVIVEFCKYGNLRNFLLKHRDSFVDQINLSTGEFDSSVQRTGNVFRFSDSYNNSNTASNSCRTEVTLDSGGGLDNAAARISGLTSPTPNTARQLTTYDLICYTYQISSGMIYLASKKLVHRDLALRNILLADEDVVKICDFGLAKDVYRKNYYRKKGQGPLPYKWMAIESIRDKVYTTESDVWSYGILLWEIFTLGANPYPGMEVDDEFYNKLNSGIRMDKPQLAPNSMYALLSQCWQHMPRDRPTFEEINSRISAIMDPDTVQSYKLRNDEYLRRDINIGHSNAALLERLNVDAENYVQEDIQPNNYMNSDIGSSPGVRLNPNDGLVNYANLLHPNDLNALNHQRALKYGETNPDRPELAPMIGSGHYLNPPSLVRPVDGSPQPSNAEQSSYLDMGSKFSLNDNLDCSQAEVRNKSTPRSTPPPRYTEVITSDGLNSYWNV